MEVNLTFMRFIKPVEIGYSIRMVARDRVCNIILELLSFTQEVTGRCLVSRVLLGLAVATEV